MSKSFLVLMSFVGGTVGSLVPVWLGDNDFFDGLSILGGLIGGLVGIWLGVKLAKRYS